MDLKKFVAKPGKTVRLKHFRTDQTPGAKDQKEAEARLAENLQALADQQERLYVQDRHAVLVVFQAMDGAGKDSTIKHVMSGINPQGVQVTSFKAPTTHELDHDYMWRSIVALPPRGTIGIHNRSYYEEVIITRVHPEILDRQRVPDELKKGNVFKRRYRHINQFEEYLTDNGTTVLKIFLHVSKGEQRRRMVRRLERPDKHWKFSLQDLKERAFWDDYMDAYEHAIANTSTDAAPWYIVPADHKWYMHLVVSEILLAALREMKLSYPKVTDAGQADLREGLKLLGGAKRNRGSRKGEQD
jgi:PPK2 family polyphosphate:nucleotide phosphotransferase